MYFNSSSNSAKFWTIVVRDFPSGNLKYKRVPEKNTQKVIFLWTKRSEFELSSILINTLFHAQLLQIVKIAWIFKVHSEKQLTNMNIMLDEPIYYINYIRLQREKADAWIDL